MLVGHTRGRTRKFMPGVAGLLVTLLAGVAAPAVAQNDASPTAPKSGTANQPVNPPPVAGEKTPPGIVTPNTKLPPPSTTAPTPAAPQAKPQALSPTPAAPSGNTPSVTGPSITAPVPALKPEATPPDSSVKAPEATKPPAVDGSKPSGDASSAKVLMLDARPVVSLNGQGTWDDGFKTIMGSVQTVDDALTKASLKQVGHPLAVFRETDDKGFKFEVMVPVDPGADRKAALPPGSVFAQSPAGKVLKFQHRDAYDAIDSTYEAITAYLEEKGYDTNNLFVEEYLNTVKTSDDPGFQVDIYVFVK